MKSNDENGRASRSGGKKGTSASQQRGEHMENNPLHELFLSELGDIYNAEQQLIKALPKMAKAAQSDELREAFENHLEETETQVERLDQMATELGENIKSTKCKAMEG